MACDSTGRQFGRLVDGVLFRRREVSADDDIRRSLSPRTPDHRDRSRELFAVPRGLLVRSLSVSTTTGRCHGVHAGSRCCRWHHRRNRSAPQPCGRSFSADHEVSTSDTIIDAVRDRRSVQSAMASTGRNTFGVCFDDGVVAAFDGSLGDGEVVGSVERRRRDDVAGGALGRHRIR